MKPKFYIFSVNDRNTTANYFVRALKKMKFDVVYLTKNFDTRKLQVNDIFFFIDPVKDFPFFLENAKCQTIAYLIDVHLQLKTRLLFSNFFDHIFVAQKEYVNIFKNNRNLDKKKSVHWLPLACDPQIHFKKGLRRQFEVAFVGQINKLISKTRYKMIREVLPRFYTNDYNKFYRNVDMGFTYSKSKIVFNHSINNDLNMRFFEALCSGALLLTDKITNGAQELFAEKFHYVSYRSKKDAIAKINYYLKNEKKRKLIALRGQKLAIKHHTYLHRTKKILDVVYKNKTIKNIAPVKCLNQIDLSYRYANIFFLLLKPYRILQTIKIYGFSVKVFFYFFLSIIKHINTIVPITPNSLRVKIYSYFKF
jgi:hypothetical protein